MRKRHMYLFATLFVASTSIFTSCLEEKDYYNPDFKTENPLEGITAPTDFDWKTTNTVNITVSVNDEFDGAYNYLIEVFDQNPITFTDATLFTRGFAKKGMSFVTKITVPATTEYVFIRQTTPTGVISVRRESTDADINCNFGGNSTRSMRSVTRTADYTVDYTPPSHDDASIFPTQAPASATEVISNSEVEGGSATAYKAYKLTNPVHSLNIGEYVELYVTEDKVIDMYSGINLSAHTKIFILPGKNLTLSFEEFNLKEGCVISIAAGATFEVHGKLNLGKGAQLHNLGTVIAYEFGDSQGVVYNAGTLHITRNSSKMNVTGSSFFYNAGTIDYSAYQAYITIGSEATFYNAPTGSIKKSEGLLNFENQGRFINDNEIDCYTFHSIANSATQNNGVINSWGNVFIFGPAEWVNNGTWTAGNLYAYPGGTYYNKCKLILIRLSCQNSTFVNDAGAFISIDVLEMKSGRIEMGSGSFIYVTQRAHLENSMDENYGIYGTGDKMAMLRMIREITSSPLAIRYDGNLHVVCAYDHPDGWIMTNGAEFGPDDYSFYIPATECNMGWGTKPTDPIEPEIKDVVDPLDYTYLFEDQWPLYGDYDMNDVVIRISQITKTPDATNKVTKLSFTYQLEAVGASTPASAALMLDGIPAANIQSVTYSDKAPTGFDTASSGVESNQTTAVIPLFADAHSFLGKGGGTFINTQKGSGNNISNVPSVTVTVTFATPIDMTFEVSSFNLFIITDFHMNNGSRKEIHQRGYQPSSKANSIFFGSGNDASTSGTYYASQENLVWSFVIPDTFKWPVEFKNIRDAYTGFAGWVQSGGVDNQSWWQTPATNDYVY